MSKGVIHWRSAFSIGCTCLTFLHCVFSNVISKFWFWLGIIDLAGNIFSDEQGGDSLALSLPHLLWLLLQSHFAALHAVITTLMHCVHCTTSATFGIALAALAGAVTVTPGRRRCSAVAIIRQYVGCHPECDVLYQPHFWDFLAMPPLLHCNAVGSVGAHRCTDHSCLIHINKSCQEPKGLGRRLLLRASSPILQLKKRAM